MRSIAVPLELTVRPVDGAEDVDMLLPVFGLSILLGWASLYGFRVRNSSIEHLRSPIRFYAEK